MAEGFDAVGDFFLVLAFVDFFLALHAFLCTFPVWDVFCWERFEKNKFKKLKNKMTIKWLNN